MSEPREFWIKGETNDRPSFVIPFEVDKNKVLVDPRCIHVIEKSAYDRLQQKCEAYEKALEFYAQYEPLELSDRHGNDFECKEATNTLKEWKGK